MKFHIGVYHEYSKAQKEEIATAKFIDNENAKYMLNPKFTVEQMRTIRCGLEERIDVSLFADPAFSALQMKQISMALRLKQYAITKCPNLTDSNIRTYLVNPGITAGEMSKVIDLMLNITDKAEFEESVKNYLELEDLELEEEEEYEI